MAEQRAERFLRERGLRTLARNYRRKCGEIDLVMRDRDTLIFVEVRLRTHLRCGTASESVTYSKQQRLIRTARWYLAEHRVNENFNCRFDVVAYDGSLEKSPEWIQNAFQAH